MPSPPTPRTTPALVEGIIEVQTGIDVSPFIAAGNLMTTNYCTYAQTNRQTPYTDGYEGSQMELIERWLSAHLYSVFDNQLTAAKAGSVSVGYQYKVDYGLRTSMYGQQAILLDNYGNLAKYDNSAKVKRFIRLEIAYVGPCRRRLWYGEVEGGWELITTEQ